MISSLLKQYFQKLPEPLIPSDLYPLFIHASKTSNIPDRLVELKALVSLKAPHLSELVDVKIMISISIASANCLAVSQGV